MAEDLHFVSILKGLIFVTLRDSFVLFVTQ
jgi:hypothetical protein